MDISFIQFRSFLLECHLAKCSVKIRCRPTTSLTKLTETSIYDSIKGDLDLDLGEPKIILPAFPSIFRAKFPNDLFYKKSNFPAKIIPDDFLVISHFIIGTVLCLFIALSRINTRTEQRQNNRKKLT